MTIRDILIFIIGLLISTGIIVAINQPYSNYNQSTYDFQNLISEYDVYCRGIEENKKSETECNNYLTKINQKGGDIINQIIDLNMTNKDLEIAIIKEKLAYVNY